MTKHSCEIAGYHLSREDKRLPMLRLPYKS
jgi:hypothetical protein